MEFNRSHLRSNISNNLKKKLINFKSLLIVNFFNHKIDSIKTVKENIRNDHIIDYYS